MAIITGGPTAAEKHQRKREVATGFAPNAAELKQLIESTVAVVYELVPDKGRVSVSKLATALTQIQRNLRDGSALIRGFASATKPYDISKDLTYLYNLTTSLVRAYTSLDTPQLVKEVRELKRRLDLLVGNIQRMYDELLELRGPAQPPGQPAVDGQPATDELVIPQDLDDAPDDLVDYDKAGLQQFSIYDQKMPGPDNPELVKVLELPVIATFHRPTTVEELNSRGFEAVNLAGYIILRKAYILGVSKANCKANGYEIERVLKATLKNIGEKLNDEMALVCETPVAYSKGGWLYYWIGPSSYHRTLGGHWGTRLTVEEFRFPFGDNQNVKSLRTAPETTSPIKHAITLATVLR